MSAVYAAASAQAVVELESDMQGEALKCDKAKQELINATTAGQVDLAERKMKILCND